MSIWEALVLTLCGFPPAVVLGFGLGAALINLVERNDRR